MRVTQRSTDAFVLALLLLTGVAANAAAQAPPEALRTTGPTPGFRSEVELVTVDVVVASKDGVPVTGLQRDDFLLSEDGQPQVLSSFEAVELPVVGGGGGTPRPPVSSNASAEERTTRSFAVLFDDVHMDQPAGQRARAAVASFLKQSVRDGDRVLLAATSGRVWWGARREAGRADLLALLERLDGIRTPDASLRERLTDYEALRIAEYHDPLICKRVERRFLAERLLPGPNADEPALANRCDPLVEARATETRQRVLDRVRATAFSLERVMDALALTRGRKSVILVSEGFVQDMAVDPLQGVIAASRRANAALYFLNVQGLQGGDRSFDAEIDNPPDVLDLNAASLENARSAEGADVAAESTGGFSVRNTNNLAAGLGRIADESRAYYLLGYVPASSARDGKFRKLAVSVSRKDVVVRARRGYFLGPARPSVAAGEAPPELKEAADAPFEMGGVPLRATTYVLEPKPPDKARVSLVADIDLRKLPFETIDGRFFDTLDVVIVVTPRDRGEPTGHADRIEMNLMPETRARNPWYSYSKELELPAGRYQAKLVVREKNGGLLGSVMHDFEVGDLNGWRIATPVLTDVAPVDPQSGRPRPVPLARRELSNDRMLAVALEVFGAAREGGQGAPRVAQGYTVLRDGQEVKRSAPSLIRPSADGRLVRLFGFGLEQLSPGPYEMVLEFVDEIAQRRQELREPFTVVAAPEPSAAN